jgi:peptide chain release factor 1
MSMWDKLNEVENRFEEVSELLSSPKVLADRNLIRQYSKEHKDLTPIVATYRAYKKAKEEHQESKQLSQSNEKEIAEMARDEAQLLEQELIGLEEELKFLLIPKDPNDAKNVIFEIRAGAGGDEASLFAGELFRMYVRYAEARGWKVEMLSSSAGSTGGFKEVIAMVNGEGAFSRLKYESGVHRVQRVPATEGAGRIHTSTVTVAVLPEAEEVEVEIADKDLRIDVYRSGGPGGQSVNTTDSAVRITHLPTGLVVAMQDEKSQLKNKEKGMRVLRARLYDMKQAEADAVRRADRLSQVGTGDRSEKSRTYNFPQSRITDHRIGLSVHNLSQVLEGDLDGLIDALVTHYQAEALKAGSAVTGDN